MERGSIVADDETRLKALIRADLPPEAFARHPWRLLLGLPLAALIAGGSAALVLLPLPWWVALPGAVAVGALYASFFFFGHEVAHGAVVGSPRLQEAVLYVTGLIYLISPHLWRIWHNRAHHRHTNEPEQDPDTFGTLEQFRANRLSQVLARFAPGSGHWLSALYLLTFFTLHSQGVLWRRDYRGELERLDRRRARLDTAGMAAFWIAVALWAGPRGALLAVVIPMLMVNFVMMSYVVTNHMLRELGPGAGALRTTMSVTTFRLLDLLFLNFSHHVEHHLFPAMSPRYYPRVRRSLRRHAGDRYLAPGHWRALRWVFRTPRVYADPVTLVQPWTGRQVVLAEVEAGLRPRAGSALAAAGPAGRG